MIIFGATFMLEIPALLSCNAVEVRTRLLRLVRLVALTFTKTLLGLGLPAADKDLEVDV